MMGSADTCIEYLFYGIIKAVKQISKKYHFEQCTYIIKKKIAQNMYELAM
jgi:hypothetical protein